LQDDARQAERSLRTAQPNASSRLRDGVAETQQADTQRRMEQMAGYIRNGYGPMMTSIEAPVTQSLDNLKDQFQRAQQAVQGGQQQNAAHDQQQRGLQQLEQGRTALENLVQQGQQPGNQPGGQQPGGQQPGNQQGQGKQQGQGQGQGGQGGGQQPGGGNQPGGNQPGGQQARAGGGGNNNGGAYNGGNIGPNGGFYGPNGGAYPVNPSLGANRNYPQGVFDAPENRNINPALIGRETDRILQDLRTTFRDDPDAERALADLQKGLEQVRFGDTASPELAERISRTVLPQWESFEVQLRRKLEESGAGQAKTAAPDKVPAGYDANVQEYSRKLSNGK
jgi:hypothetical protein